MATLSAPQQNVSRQSDDENARPVQQERRYKVLLVATHPVQYAAPVFRRMSEHPRLDILVAYCSLLGAEAIMDSGFGLEFTWDVPLLEGYPWKLIRNLSPRPGLERFFGLVNPDLWRMLRGSAFDAVVIYTGYRHASFWIAAAAAKIYRKPLLLATDAHDLRARDGRSWKKRLKSWVWPVLFGRLADVVIVPSSRGVALMRSLGIPQERVVLTPYTVNNEWWIRHKALVDRRAVRSGWGVPESAPVALFCAKLQPWKRPLDLLRAFAKAGVPETYLVYAGEGPLRARLEAEARTLGMSDRVRFLGFINQSQLPSVYAGSDVLVLPSEHEPFGVVVNEAMLCGCPVVVSDRVGAGYDLVRDGQTGYVFGFGDVDALAAVLRDALADRQRLKRMGEAARDRMQTWSPRDNVEATLCAVEAAISARQGRALR